MAGTRVKEDYVSLKILKAEESAISREVATLKRLAGIQLNHPGKQHIRLLQDDFQISGPNGNHQCLVLDLAGPSIAALYNIYYGVQYSIGARRLRAATARKMNKQLVDAVDFLHINHLFHGDIALPNVLFKLRPLGNLTESQIFEIFGAPKKRNLKPTPDNHNQKSGPSYVVEPAKLPPAEHLLDEIFLVDFGEAFSWDKPPLPEDIGIPYMYRAPEAMFEFKYNWQSEIWALACVLFEIRAGSGLFINVMGSSDEIVVQWVGMKGKMPEPWWSRWERRTEYFDDDGKPHKTWPNGMVRAVEFTMMSVIDSISDDDDEDAISKRPCPTLLEPAHTKVTKEEAESMHDLLSKMLTWQQERIPAASVKQHEWLQRWIWDDNVQTLPPLDSVRIQILRFTDRRCSLLLSALACSITRVASIVPKYSNQKRGLRLLITEKIPIRDSFRVIVNVVEAIQREELCDC